MSSQNYSGFVWVEPEAKDDFSIPFGCRILRTDKNKCLVRDDDGKEFWIPSNNVIKEMHITSQSGVNDMITLGDLQEYAILRNLHMRYNNKNIYTYTGAMLIAVNPYEILPIYTNREITMYRNKKIGDLPPHIFAIGDNAFQQMQNDKCNQCIVISGESGAGKTESTKLILQYLAAISGKHSWIEQQIIEANPIMEAFGNAKTVRNDNSSRFGKYIDIHFSETGVILGAKIEQYLLEKSRIVSQNHNERNYHIFYSLLAGLSPDEKKKLDLEDASKYNYLKQGNCLVCDGRNDATEFADIRSAMQVLSFSDEEVWNIFCLLAAILHLGNLKIHGTVIQNMDSAEINDSTNLAKISNLLQIDKQSLCIALTKKTIFIQGERVVTSLSKVATSEGRDAFTKALYGRIFVRIIEKINETIYKPKSSSFSIGVLDIFGFENFNLNSFEQLCINYANENLQQFFVKHIFKMEQDEYTNEGINWQNIEFIDNQEILDMIGIKSMNIMSLIDEESKFPKGNDKSLLEKLHMSHGTRTIYLKPKSSHTAQFGIHHYAGVVYYNPNGFLEKNRDSFSLDLKEMILQSNNKYLVNLFAPDGLLDTSKKSVTLSLQFRNSLDLLMKTLSACHPFFIRCIKPNEVKQPNKFDKNLCVRQLRYSGIMETTKIRKAGYPIRHIYLDFVTRYRHLVPGLGPIQKLDCHEAAKNICEKILPQTSDYQLGYTKIFLKDSDDAFLENERARIHLKYILIIQRGFRRVIFKKWLNRHRRAATLIQKTWRGYTIRKRFLIMRNGFYRLQACIRSRTLAYQFTKIHTIIGRLQAFCRGYMAREKLKKLKELAAIRSNEEKELQKSGNPNWKEIAQENYSKRFKDLSRSTLGMTIADQYHRSEDNSHEITGTEDENKFIDKVFDFFNTTPSENPSPSPSSSSSTASIDDSHHQNKDISKGQTIRLPKGKKYSEDLSEFNFEKFAATYFIGNVSYKYSKRPLKESLLEHEFQMDKISAQAIWITILRFMGDVAEAKFDDFDYDDDNENGNNGENMNFRKIPIMQNLTTTLSRAFKKHENTLLAEINSETEHQKLIHRTLKKKSKLPGTLKRSAVNAEYYENWLSRRSSNLEKIHFIIGHGILRPELRDEIFCQICKQLIDNPYYTSFAKGWILLSLCLGCFSPSKRFEKYLRNFIRKGPKLFSPHCENQLDRTLINGPRTQPPSWLELHATRKNTRITLNVILMDGNMKKLQIDSASTSKEAVEQLSVNIGLKDYFGFSLVITLFDKIMSLGCGREHIMDAISSCEQFTKEQGHDDRKVFWKLYFRKEIFSPWYDPSIDELTTDLIYKQIVRGINFGEYRCKKDTDIAIISALQYYAENGARMDRKLLRKLLPDYIPKDLLSSGDIALDKWEKLVLDAFEKSDYVRRQKPQQLAKEDIAIFAKINWPMMFSRFFEVVQIEGPKLDTNNLILAVNWKGVFLIDETEKILTEFDFIEIISVAYEEDETSKIDEFLLNTIQKEYFKFKSYDAKDICELINFILENLKSYSTYVVAIQNYQNVSDDIFEFKTNHLQFSKGDLIKLEGGVTGETVLKQENRWCYGECNGAKGAFPTEMVYVLPTILEPSAEVLNIFKDKGENALKIKKYQRIDYSTIKRKKLHTLHKFSAEHFRSNIMLPRPSQTIHVVRTKTEELWRHTRDPIKAPLLKKLQKEKHLFDTAVAIFVYILKYMGDLPRGRAPINTDLIFSSAIKNENLRDEVFCQIMKQLTDNRIYLSEERGWDLMWLATGVMYPSSLVMKELVEFLKTRFDYHPLASESLKRVQKIISSGLRKHPPYIIEVDAIQNRAMQIYHKIYFPDDSDEAFEIQSTTRCHDLISAIAKRLNLKSTDGFSLFIKVQDKVFSIPENDYLFDFITDILLWLRETMPFRQTTTLGTSTTNEQNNSNVNINFMYQLYFMKKLWINSIMPGKDINADIIFYYPQELRKYLNGYYKISKTEAIQNAILLHRADFVIEDKQTKQKITDDIITKLIPKDIITLRKLDDWKKDISNKLETVKTLNDIDAKIEFLKVLSQQPTFGSTFFIVEQSNDTNLPKVIMIAINRNGLHIIDPVTKDILVTYAFTDLNFWSSGNSFFHIRFGNMIGASKLLCTTTQGYKIDDLISSYIKYLYPNTMKN